MQSLLDDPMVQTGIAPLLVALLVGGALLRTRLAWFAVAAAFATAVGLSTGIGFTPLTASRKVLLLVLAAPFVGLVLDLVPRPPRWSMAAIGALCGLASVWVFWTVLSQREAAQWLPLAGGVAVFVALLVGLTLRLRTDGVAGGAATVALGLAVGVAALLSASIGNLANGVSVAAGGGAMLLLQFALGRAIAPGFVGTLTTGLGAALFTASTFVLAQLPWYTMPLLLLVPLAASLDAAPERSPRVRMLVVTVVALAAASLTVLAAWLATRGVAA
jgi:hypothetical protein